MFSIHPQKFGVPKSVVALVVLFLLLTTGCSGTENDDPFRTTTGEGAAPAPISLAVDPSSDAAAITAAIAEQLIESRLGNPVTVSGYSTTPNMLKGLADGDYDANLEIWSSVFSARDTKDINDLSLDQLGSLDSTGKVGWYVPGYVIEQDPALATWEGYRNAGTKFATEQTAPNGRFLGIDSIEYEQFDEELVDELKLPFEVEFSLSEEQTIAELKKATAAKDPILVYWWTPRPEIATFDLVNVKLPERTEACLKKAEGEGLMGCDYPEVDIIKLGSPGLAEKDPNVRAFLTKLNFDTGTQVKLLSELENEDTTPQAVAANWIEDNRATWQPWFGTEE